MSGSIGNVPAMKFDVGQTIGGYEFLDLLDSSPTGVTYKVRNVLVKRVEVLKVLPKPGFPFWPWHGHRIHPRCAEYHVFWVRDINVGACGVVFFCGVFPCVCIR